MNSRYLVLSALFIFFAHDLNLFADSGHGRSSNPSSNRTTAAHDDCLKQLTKEEEVRLLNEVDRIQKQFFVGRQTPEQRDQALSRIFNALNPTGDPSKEIALRAKTMEVSNTAATGPVLEIISRMAKGEPPIAKDLEMVRGLGASDPNAYLEGINETYGHFFKALFDIGATFDSKTGFDFKEAKLNLQELRKNATLQTAFRLFVSPEVTEQLLYEDRQNPVFLGDTVFSPVGRNGEIPAMSQSDYERKVKWHLDLLSRETDTFIRASKKANTYWEMMRGRLWDREDKGPAEIERDGAHQIMTRTMTQLRRLGMIPELRRHVLSVHREAAKIEAGHIQDGYTALNMATAAAIAAPLIPVLIYAAPFAGAAAGISAATMTNASATMAAIPMVFTLGRSAVHAGINYSRNGGSVWCHMAKTAVEGGTQGLVGGAVGAALPLVPALAASAAAGLGASSAVVATTHGAVNLGVALAFFGLGANGVKNEFLECYHTLQRAKISNDHGNSEEASLNTTNALKICMDAGIDLAFAIVSTKQLLKQGQQIKEQIKTARAEQKLSTNNQPTSQSQGGTPPKEVRVGAQDLSKSDATKLKQKAAELRKQLTTEREKAIFDENIKKLDELDTSIAQAQKEAKLAKQNGKESPEYKTAKQKVEQLQNQRSDQIQKLQEAIDNATYNVQPGFAPNTPQVRQKARDILSKLEKAGLKPESGRVLHIREVTTPDGKTKTIIGLNGHPDDPDTARMNEILNSIVKSLNESGSGNYLAAPVGGRPAELQGILPFQQDQNGNKLAWRNNHHCAEKATAVVAKSLGGKTTAEGAFWRGDGSADTLPLHNSTMYPCPHCWANADRLR